MYRPQFAYPPPPPDFEDVDFVYSFDPTNIPALNIRFAPGQSSQRIPLPLQSDAAWLHRGIQMNPAPSNLGVQVFDAFDKPISDDFVPPSIYSVTTVNPVAVLEPELEAPPGASYQISIKNFSDILATIPISTKQITPVPVLVDPVTFGFGQVVGNAVSAQSAFGPFIAGGALYMLITPTTGFPASLQMFRSVDGGASWTLQDGVDSPGQNAQAFFDGQSTVIVAVSSSNQGTDGTVSLINFDLSSNTWGAAYGTSGGPTTQAVYGVYERPDGSILVIHNPRAGTGTSGTGLFVAIFASGVWATNFDAGTGITSLPGYDATTDFTQTAQAVVDASGNTHIFFSTAGSTGTPRWENRVFYQQVLASDALGPFFDFPGNDDLPQTIAFWTSSNPVLVGDNVMMGIVQFDPTSGDDFSSMIIGRGLASPVFSYMGTPGIDPNNFAIGVTENNVAPVLFYDGQTLWAIEVVGTISSGGSLGNQLWLCYNTTPLTNPQTGWNSTLIFDLVNVPANNGVIDNTGNFIRPSINVLGPDIFISAESDVVAALGGDNARFFLGKALIEPLRIQFRGVKRFLRRNSKQVCAR